MSNHSTELLEYTKLLSQFYFSNARKGFIKQIKEKREGLRKEKGEGERKIKDEQKLLMTSWAHLSHAPQLALGASGTRFSQNYFLFFQLSKIYTTTSALPSLWFKGLYLNSGFTALQSVLVNTASSALL